MSSRKDRSRDNNLTATVSRRQKEYPGEGVFTGQIIGGSRSGSGILRERNGTILYDGEWKNDKPCGYGRKYFPRTGDRHEGSYMNGERHGLGVYLWANGDKYSGDWQMGLMDGRGRFEWASSGEIYNGNWRKGKMTGDGVKILSDGSKLQGTFQNGALNGWAEKSFAEGDVYKGNFKDNSRSGYGEYVWADGRSYRGNWEADCMHGQGELITAAISSSSSSTAAGRGGSSGSALPRHIDFTRIESVVHYRGEFQRGRLQGYGTAALFDGSTYTGEWKEDKCHGWGRMLYTDGSVYEGDFSWGVRSGQGQLMHHIPNVYSLQSMETSSSSTTTAPVNTAAATAPVGSAAAVEVGVFEPPLEELDFATVGRRVSVEAVLFTWGGVYIGEWRSDHPQGEGTLQLLNGQLYQGSFANGRIQTETTDS